MDWELLLIYDCFRWGEGMSFYIETTEIDLGDTLIENIFINDFMPMANGTYVKVYLLGYKYASDRDESIKLDNKTIAKHLQIPLSDVLSAWDFWEDKGIIEKMDKLGSDKFDYKIKFLNLKQLYINNNYRPVNMDTDRPERKSRPKSTSFTAREVLEINEMPRINEMFNNIDYTIRRALVPNEKKAILEWISEYNMNPDVIEKAFFQAMEKKGKRDIRYVHGIIRNWYDDGITTLEAYQDMLKKNNERYYNYDRILKALGVIGTGITDGGRELVDKWFDDYEMDLDLILAACKEGTRKSSNPNFNYIDRIISDWHEQGIKTVEEVGEKDKRIEEIRSSQAKTINRPSQRPNRFHNFKQRTSDYSEEDLERIAKNKRQEYFNKVKGEIK